MMFGDTKKTKKGRRIQRFTSGPKKSKGAAIGMGKKKTAGHNFGNVFGVTPKKPEPDEQPRTMKATRAARNKRLEKIFI